MDNTLTIELFLLGCALPVALEAYKAVGRAKFVLWAISALFVVLGFGFPWIAKVAPVVAATFAAVIGSPASWFTLAVALFLVLRPYWAAPQVPTIEPQPPYDDAELKREVASLKFAQEGVPALLKEIAEDGTKLEALEMRMREALDHQCAEYLKNIEEGARQVDRLEGSLDGFKVAVQGMDKTFHDNIVIIQRNVAEGITRLTARFDEVESQNGQRLDNLYLALAAIQDRERLARVSEQIDAIARNLTEAVSDGSVLDDKAWGGWLATSKVWAALVAEWIETADRYERGAGDMIAKLHEQMLEGEWNVKAAQFPVDNAYHHYQKFRIRYYNWKGVKERVEERVRRAAFEGQAEAILRGEVQ